MAVEQRGAEEVCKTFPTGSIPAIASKMRYLISKWKMRNHVKWPGFAHLKDLPDNHAILCSNNADWLAHLVEREYYWPALRYNGYYPMIAASILRDMYKTERDKNIALSKENSKLKRR